MRIAQIAPLAEAVPPPRYGGTERVVAYLTEELVRAGHEVTLFASGDSCSSARLVPCAPRSLRTDPSRPDPLVYHVLELEQVRRQADEFDLFHFHIDFLHFPLCYELPGPTLTTLHGRLDRPDLAVLFELFSDLPIVSISHAQREPIPRANWIGTVYHGLPLALYPPRFSGGGGYLAFLGRICPEKGPEQAVEIACRAGLPLKIAAKVDPVDEGYWRQRVEPLIARSPGVEFLGEIDDRQKVRFLGEALALLFPIDWPEPFGMVLIEAMACGTPVIAYRRGAVPEVVVDGESGWIVDSVEEAVEAVRAIGALDRRRVRALAAQRFSSSRMADDYLALYRRLLGGGGPERPKPADSRKPSLLDEWSRLSPAEKSTLRR
ncbi:D-inositol 3-phosphate glycosyltransferase [Methylacidimicrobium cyclopophantes]|uniref:D-inositol 3-phosphate glycosyltransferase n=1 Tax=Methylacidimicrobium cyclopophantes TaxID=1041766 RepID=A0A5E6MF12_9BACT|nr:glycosyltransferase family 4 protein [Methylacidimicrobium cyclopophantes]VVM07829.1 D-inositol 3-phosphate glycosyltransferase [Methylacidimicrobium cyclopophantes]